MEATLTMEQAPAPSPKKESDVFHVRYKHIKEGEGLPGTQLTNTGRAFLCHGCMKRRTGWREMKDKLNVPVCSVTCLDIIWDGVEAIRREERK